MSTTGFFRRHPVLTSLLALALLAKLLWLGRIPGINGDEAISAVWMLDWTDGVAGWPWWTPTKRLMVPVYTVIVLGVTELLPRGFGFMRVAPLICHVALLGCAWWCLRNSMSTRDRAVFVLLLCALPLHTTFARVAWEPSLIPVASFLTIHFARERRFPLASAALYFAVLTHSTCIFLAPIVYMLWFHDLWLPPSAPATVTAERRSWSRATAFVVSAALTAVIGKLVLAGAESAVGSNLMADAWQRISYPRGLLEAFGQLLHTLTGRLSFAEFTSGTAAASPHPVRLGAVVLLAMLVPAIAGMWRQDHRQAVFVMGIVVAMTVFYAVAGNGPWQVGYQRYVLWLSVPMVFAIHDALQPCRRRAEMLMLLCAALLAYTATGYFHKALTRGPATFPPIYATGAPEPKRAALEWIEQSLPRAGALAPASNTSVPVLADSWWLYWPARYWLHGLPADVFHAEDPMSAGLPKDRQRARVADIESVLAQDGFVIALSKGPMAERIRQSGMAARFNERSFNDAANQPMITVWHGRRPSSDPSIVQYRRTL